MSILSHILRLALLLKVCMFLIGAGGVPLPAIGGQGGPIRTLVSLQQELSAFSRLPLVSKIAQIRENPSETHLVLQLLDDLQDSCMSIRRYCDLVSDVIREQEDADEHVSEELIHLNTAIPKEIFNLGNEED